MGTGFTSLLKGAGRLIRAEPKRSEYNLSRCLDTPKGGGASVRGAVEIEVTSSLNKSLYVLLLELSGSRGCYHRFAVNDS